MARACSLMNIGNTRALIGSRSQWASALSLFSVSLRRHLRGCRAERRVEAVGLFRVRDTRGLLLKREEEAGGHGGGTETIDATARAFLETHRSRTRYRPLDAAVRSAPLDDAYRIQDALHRLMADAGRGEIAGWKIALTSKAMQQMTGRGPARRRRHLLEGRASLACPCRTDRVSPPGSRVRGGGAPRRRSAGVRRAVDSRDGGEPRGRVHARLRAGRGRRRGLQDARRLHPRRPERLERRRGPRVAL